MIATIVCKSMKQAFQAVWLSRLKLWNVQLDHVGWAEGGVRDGYGSNLSSWRMQLTCIAKYLPQHVTSISETLQFNLRSDTRVYLDSRCILCHAVYRQTETFTSASVLKTKKKYIFGYFDPGNIFLHNENSNFSGWPSRYFGEKEALTFTSD